MLEIPEGAWTRGQALWPEDGMRGSGMRERPILETLGHVVARHGGDVALEDGERRLSFEALWHAVGGLGRQIVAAGGGAGPVGVLLGADVSYTVALLACLAAGRPAVLLDPGVPASRTAELLRQTGATLVLEPLGGGGGGDLPRVRVTLDAMPGAPPSSGVAVDAPAFILCTSGSTGRPKAIVHSQHTMMHKAWGHVNGSGMRPGELCLSLSPPATTGGAIGMFACAASGTAFRFLDLRVAGITGLIDALRELPVVHLRAAPSALRLLTALPYAAEVLGRLRSVTIYGEPVLRDDAALLRGCLPPGAVMFGSYGSTESGSLAWHPSGEDAYDAVRTPVGRLVLGSDAAILDDDGRVCGVDEPGELVLRSRYNALGEWEEGRCVPGRLTPDPADGSLRVHRTGDIAWRAADGVFVVLGRKDRMLKVNGQRIEPAEIEAAVRACPGVTECAVVPRVRGTSQAIVAFVTLGPAAGVNAIDGVRTALRGRLPGMLMPSRIIALGALPLLPGGKVDLMALRAMAAGET